MIPNANDNSPTAGIESAILAVAQALSAGVQWPLMPQWSVDAWFGSGSATRSTKTAAGGGVYTLNPGVTLKNPTNYKLKMNFSFTFMGQGTAAGQNFQPSVYFDGVQVSPSLYYDGATNYWMLTTTFTYTFNPGQSVLARVFLGGNGAGTVTDNSTDGTWLPHLVGAVAGIS